MMNKYDCNKRDYGYKGKAKGMSHVALLKNEGVDGSIG